MGRIQDVQPDMCWTALERSSASSRLRSRTRWPRPSRGTASHGRPIPATPTARRSLRLPAPREVLAGWLRLQAQGCADLGSPFYASLLESAANDLHAEGAVWDVLAGFETESEWSAVSLRLMGAVHRLVLQELLPQLAAHYPSVGG